MKQIQVVGGGPAGSTAAIAALLAGSSVELVEKSKLPRHKVCGEFLSPEIAPILDRLGVLSDFLEAKPARIQRLELHFGAKMISTPLPDGAYGLSRYRYDQLLYGRAIALGAKASKELGEEFASRIWTPGRRTTGTEARGKRVFGFKSHFTGPTHDAVELYFFRGAYVGINCVENGITNVCGLGPERLLHEFQFEIDDVLSCCPALAERLGPLTRTMKWLNVGPLVFQNNLKQKAAHEIYVAGDALSFVDPFTGSGLLSAAITGELAGRYAAAGTPSAEHLMDCKAVLAAPFGISCLMRNLARTQWAERLAAIVPSQWLYRLTRPGSAL